MNNHEYIPQRAMSIHAHPDDQEFSVGGTLAKWSQAGCEIISVIITSGDLGSNDPAKDGSHKKELAELREKEQLAANAVLGVKETIFLRYPDGELEPTIALAQGFDPSHSPTQAGYRFGGGSRSTGFMAMNMSITPIIAPRPRLRVLRSFRQRGAG